MCWGGSGGIAAGVGVVAPYTGISIHHVGGRSEGVVDLGRLEGGGQILTTVDLKIKNKKVGKSKEQRKLIPSLK